VHVQDISDKLLRLTSWRRSAERESLRVKALDEQPLRAELFSVEQLERHAKAIAASHQLAAGTAPDKLLPRLPRAYGISLELIAHVDGRIEAASLNSFIASYQSVESLKLGELWALPLMLRLALIENLRRVAVRIAAARRDRDMAGDWAERMVSVVEQKPTDLILVLADMARANPPLSGAFLAELTRHLQGQNPNFAFANSWFEHRLADQGRPSNWCVPKGKPRRPIRFRSATALIVCDF
jgi:hypothetical protein